MGGTLAETGYFDAATLKRMLREHESGLRDYSAPLWTVLMFEAFLRCSDASSDPAVVPVVGGRDRAGAAA
jgi:asparagine synthase (glutamine-hydrolysing)